MLSWLALTILFVFAEHWMLGYSINVLDISIAGLQNRIFPNVSYGLENDNDYQRQCSSSGRLKEHVGATGKNEMVFTPNRRVHNETLGDADHQRLQLGFVLVVGGHNDNVYDYGPAGSVNGLMSVWDSWLEHFFTVSSNTTSIVLLFDERDFNRQNNTRSKKEYLDNILIWNMGAEPVDCVHLQNKKFDTLHEVFKNHVTHPRRKKHSHVPHHGPAAVNHSHINRKSSFMSTFFDRSNDLGIDQGYRLYYIDVAHAGSPHQLPLIIFAAVYSFPKPAWAEKEDEEQLFVHWRPFRLNKRYPTNYAYTKYTNWYAHHMLNLKVLDFFDYAGKLDSDVSFVAPFPEPNLPRRMANSGALMLVTQKEWYSDDPRISAGVRACLDAYTAEENKHCETVQNRKGLVPRGMSSPLFWEGGMERTFRAHFLVYWLGLYTSPETKHMSKFWNDWHPHGMWDYRWGDQQWWPRPIAMFGSGDIDKEIDRFDLINTDNEKYVVHKLWPRQSTIKLTRYYNVSGSTRKERDALFADAASRCSTKSWTCT